MPCSKDMVIYFLGYWRFTPHEFNAAFMRAMPKHRLGATLLTIHAGMDPLGSNIVIEVTIHESGCPLPPETDCKTMPPAMRFARTDPLLQGGLHPFP